MRLFLLAVSLVVADCDLGNDTVAVGECGRVKGVLYVKEMPSVGPLLVSSDETLTVTVSDMVEGRDADLTVGDNDEDRIVFDSCHDGDGVTVKLAVVVGVRLPWVELSD